MKAPDEIYLQGYIGHDTEGVTWCEDQINDDDVRYVRADLAARRTVSRQDVVGAMQGYLRQCQVGGMSKEVSDQIERAVKQADHLGYLATPIPATEQDKS